MERKILLIVSGIVLFIVVAFSLLDLEEGTKNLQRSEIQNQTELVLTKNQHAQLNAQCDERKKQINKDIGDRMANLNQESQSQELLFRHLLNKNPFLAFYSESLDSCLMVHRGEGGSYVIFNDTKNEIVSEMPESEIDAYREKVKELSGNKITF